MHVLEDRVLETSATTGTGDITLAGAVTGFRTFGSVMAIGDTCWYYIEGVDGSGVPTGEFETGMATYSASNTLSRSSVDESSNSNNLVNLSSGTKRVGLTIVATSVMSQGRVVAQAQGMALN